MMNTSPASSARRAPIDDGFTSNLGDGKQRFLSQVIAYALASHLRTAKDFVRHFPPSAIMSALSSQPRLRANIVVPVTGLHEKVALKKSAESMGEDLQIALDEGVIDEDAIVRLFDPDDRVRYLNEKKLWAFLAEGDFWKSAAPQGTELAIAKQNVAYMLDCARANGLITDHDIVEGLTLDRILDALPKSELAKLVRSAVAGGRHGRPFDDEALLGALAPAALLDHVPLAQMWEAVVLARVALPHGLVGRGSVAPPPLQALPAPPPVPSASDDDEVVVEIVENEPSASRPATKGPRNRRIGASDLSEMKSEIGEGNSSKN
jgi:hypothetical protein